MRFKKKHILIFVVVLSLVPCVKTCVNWFFTGEEHSASYAINIKEKCLRICVVAKGLPFGLAVSLQRQ